jgi:hypothetical protein
MENMLAMLQGTEREVKVLPLTVTRRCPPAVVEIAQSIVPAFECVPELWMLYQAWKTAGSQGEPPMEYGMVVQASKLEFMRSHMVLCRTNAPLVSAA